MNPVKPSMIVEHVAFVVTSGIRGADVVDVELAADASKIDLPGPSKRPVRPHLEPFVSGTGLIAARVVLGDGRALAVAVVPGAGSETLTLPAPPLALARRTDGAWALYRDRLIYHGSDGSSRLTLALTGIALVGSEHNGVWVVGSNTATHVDGAGNPSKAHPWGVGLASVAIGPALCGLGKRGPKEIACLQPDGSVTTTPPPAPAKPLEQLLALPRKGGAVVAQGSTIRWYDAGGVETAINAQSAGRTKDGEAFVSLAAPGAARLLVAGAAERLLALPQDVSTANPLGVVSVDDQRVLATSVDRAVWFRNEVYDRDIALDDARFRSEVFPSAWRLASARGITALPDGKVLLSATGPDGMILVSLQPVP